jgi:polyisoprenoid-binding protein YceI
MIMSTQTQTQIQAQTQSPRETTTQWTLDPTHSLVGFSAKHMVITTVRGRFNEVKGTLELDRENPARSRVSVEIPTATIDTGVKQRDDHLRGGDFLEVEKYPAITFVSRRVEGDALREGGKLEVIGDLTIKGVTREVKLDVEFEGIGKDPWGGERAGFRARTKIDRRDFGLTWNQALEAGGLLVSNEIGIELEVQAKADAVAKAA